MPTSNFRVDHAIICDDFRVENTGKGLMIGIYGNELSFPQPGALFTFFACLLGQAKGPFSINVQIDFVATNKIHSNSMTAVIDLLYASPEKDKWVDFLLPVGAKPMPINGAGRIVVKAKPVTAKAWKVVTQK